MRTLNPRTWRWLDWVVAVVFVLLTVGGTVASVWLVRHGLAIRRLASGVGDTTFFTADGRPWFRMDEQRRDVKLTEIAPKLQEAVIAVEDHRFFHHLGIDPLGVGRAVVENVRGDNLQGASTITQQLARTLFLSNQRTMARKVKEAALALLLEQQLTKTQILELYLNRVYLSSGVYGVEPLSRRLFGKPAKALTLPEAAMVAGLIRAPSALSPWSNYDGALARSRVVLQRMREERYIDRREEELAARARPRIRAYELAVEARGGYVKEYLRQQFRNAFGGDHPPDWRVETTVLPEIQDAAERAVSNGLRRLNRPGLQAALVAIEPRTGKVLALVGGSDFRATPFNRATRSRRQPGSAFKPFVYLSALDKGWAPTSFLRGLSTISFSGTGPEEEWSPRNASGQVEDEMTLREAVIESNNRAAVALQQAVGSRAVLRVARDSGLHDLPDVPSLALGTGLVSPFELTRAFAVFPNGGIDVEPHGLVRVVDADGDVALDVVPDRRTVASPEAAYQMLSILRDVVDRGTGQPTRALGVRGPIAGKTGTTNDFKDAWFVGFSSAAVVGVWVGFDQPATIGREGFGARMALPIWAEFMRSTARRLPPKEFTRPAGLQDVELCRVSYLKPLDGCPTYHEVFKEGDEIPSRSCPIHEGSFKQEAKRAFEGFFDALKRRIGGMFK